MKLSSLASALFIVSNAVSAAEVSSSSRNLRRNDNANDIEKMHDDPETKVSSEGHRMLPKKNRVRDHQWSNYKWNTGVTNSITVKDKLSAGYPRKGINVWNKDDSAGLPQDAGVYCPAATIGSPLKFAVTDESWDPECPFANGEISVCNGNYGDSGWLGIAEISTASGGTITRGRAVNNDSYERMQNPRWQNLVLCQEVGHVIGLDHQDENHNNERLPTCMDYTSITDEHNETPDSLDYDVLCRIYNGVEGYDCGASGSDGGGGGGPPPGKGKPAEVAQHVQEMQAKKFKHFGELSTMHPLMKSHAVFTKPDPEISGNTLVTHLILAQDDDVAQDGDEVLFP